MNRIRNWALIIITLSLLGIGMIFSSPGTSSNWGLLITAAALGAWLLVLRLIDNKRVDPRIIALVATMAALATLSRVAFAPVASFKPTTFIIMITGYVGGPSTGFAVGALTGLASNFFLGQGPWTPWQMAAWGLCGMVAGWLGLGQKDFRIGPFLALSALMGVVFGWIMNIWHWVGFIEPLNGKTLAAVYIASLPFDLLHAAGNVVFGWLLGKPFYRIISRVYKRIKIAQLPIDKAG